MKKTLSLLLCAVLMLSLCACGKTTETPAAETGTVLDAQQGQLLLYALTEKYDPNAVVLTADGTEVSWSVFYNFLQQNLSTFLYYGGLPTDYSAEVDEGVTMDRALVESAETALRRLVGAAGHSEITAEELDADFTAYWEDMLEQYGGEEQLMEAVTASGYTKDSLKFLYSTNEQVQNAFTHTYGENFADISDEMVDSWVKENGLVRAKHILLMTNDESLTDADKAAKKQQLEDVRAELLAIEDDLERETAFDDRMDTLSEDTGLFMYPDGYVFGAGEMVQEFEDAAFALQPYELSEVVETAYGYHLLLGLRVEKDCVMDYDQSSYAPITVANTVANEDFSTKLSDWAENVKLEYSDDFAGFTVQSLFENYDALLKKYAYLLSGDGAGEDGKLHVVPYGFCETCDTSDSAFIDAARYYESGHLILSIEGRDVAFANVPASLWEQFKASDVKGTFYKKYLKGNAAYAIPGAKAGKEAVVVVEE